VGLACIATALNNAGYKPDILDIDLYRFTDDQINDFLAKHHYDIVGLGNIVSSYRITKKLCIQVKQAMPNALVVVGNTVATSIPELLLSRIPAVDIAVIGEGDRTIVDIVTKVSQKKPWQTVPGIAYRSDGMIVKTGKRKPIPRMEDIPFPDYMLFDFDQYLAISHLDLGEPLPFPREQMKAIPINTARGCPFRCTFCNHAFKDYKYRYYPFSMVIKYFKAYQQTYGVNYLKFWDELTLLTLERARELCNAIENEKITFYWSVNPRGNLFSRNDLDLLKRYKELGALMIGGALESGAPEILHAMHKHPRPKEYVKQFIEQADTVWEAGLVPQTSLVFGYPQETKETIRKTFEVCRQIRVYPSAGFVLPLPGTPIYQIARERGLIEDEEQYLLRIGDRQDLHLNMTQMSDNELVETVTEGLIKLKNELGIPLSDDQVIKTTFYRAARKTT